MQTQMDDHMAAYKEKGKKGLIFTTWERCKSIGGRRGRNNSSSSKHRLTKKSKSWPRMDNDDMGGEEEEKRGRKCRVAPEGCFSVYVGDEKQRFVIKAEYANHPLFRMLLEEAESEYGYNSQGPLWLPCNVEIFKRVLIEMDDQEDGYDVRQVCVYPKRFGAYHLLSPSRLVAINQV